MSNILKLNPYVYLSERTDTAEGEKRYDLFILVPVDQATKTDIDYSQTVVNHPGAVPFVFVDYSTVNNPSLPSTVKYRFLHLIVDKKRNGIVYSTVKVRSTTNPTQTIGIAFADADATPVSSIPGNFELLHAPYIHLHKESEQVGGQTVVSLRASSVVVFDTSLGLTNESVTISRDNLIHTADVNSGNTVEPNPDNFVINQSATFAPTQDNFFESAVTESGTNPPRRRKAKVKSIDAGGGGVIPARSRRTNSTGGTSQNGSTPVKKKSKTP